MLPGCGFGTLLVETKMDEQSKEFLKQKLLGSYPVLVEKQKSRNSDKSVIFCYQVDGCSCEEILADVTDQYV
jgi:hypothetical protein